MTTDQMLYVAARIHDWNKTEDEIILRAIGIVKQCEYAEGAQKKIDEMKSRGLTALEMLQENARERPSSIPSELLEMLKRISHQQEN